MTRKKALKIFKQAVRSEMLMSRDPAGAHGVVYEPNKIRYQKHCVPTENKYKRP